MNILLISCTHWWNAEAHYGALLAAGLRDAGHTVWVLTQPGTRHAAQLERRKLPLVTDIPLWTRNPLRLPALRRQLAEFLSRNAVQVVDVLRSHELLVTLWAARGLPGVRVVRTRGSAHPLTGHWLNQRLYRACDGLIASANVLRDGMVHGLGLPPDAVRTIYFPAEAPLDWGDAERAQRRERLLRELKLPADAQVLCIVGRVFPEKGHDRLIAALPTLRRMHPRAVLLIADKGYPDERPHRERLQAQIADLSLGEAVRWLGFRDDVREVMACADYGVIPSLTSEMNCRVAMEFLSAGTPVVAFPTGALPEVIENNVTGVVTADHTPDALAGMLGALLANSGLRALMAKHGREAAVKRFSRRHFLDETLAVFQAALAKPRSP